MQAISSLPPRSGSLPELGESVPNVSSLQSRLREISLTIVGPLGNTEGPAGEIRLQLDHPLIGPEDIPVNEFIQQLGSLAETPVQVFMLAEAVKNLSQGSEALAGAMLQSQAKGAPRDPETLAAGANELGQQAEVVERSLRDLIENSTYPNFSDFLRDLVKIAQELREAASKAKLAAIDGQYSVMYSAAEQMKVAAEKAKESRDTEIEASKKEAIGQIVGGLASAFVSGVVFRGSQLGATLGASTQQIVSGSFSLAASGDKLDASALQLESDLANVAKQRLEAAAKLIESQVQIAQDLRDIATSLRDMVTKLMQDFISSQNQVIQRANV
jgi:Arc/MetJ-type ribon-helix-helix transcriptional regulator